MSVPDEVSRLLGVYPCRWPRTLQTLTLGDRFDQSLAGRSDLAQLPKLDAGKGLRSAFTLRTAMFATADPG